MDAADPFETIVSNHYELLYKFALSLTRAESDARDLTQQTFYIWAKKGHQLRDISKVKTWLFTTLHREFLVARRKQSRFPHHDLEEVAAQLPAMNPALAKHVDALLVLSALAKLDEIFQSAVALFYLEDCPYKDIAVILEVPIGTVKSRISRGIVLLRQILGSTGDPPVPSGCRPNETEKVSALKTIARKITNAISLPSGELALGTGGSPVPPTRWVAATSEPGLGLATTHGT